MPRELILLRTLSSFCFKILHSVLRLISQPKTVLTQRRSFLMLQLCPGRSCSCGSLSFTAAMSCSVWAWLRKGGDLLSVDRSLLPVRTHCTYEPTSSQCCRRARSLLPTVSHWSDHCLSCRVPETVPVYEHVLPRLTIDANLPMSDSISHTVVVSFSPPNMLDLAWLEAYITTAMFLPRTMLFNVDSL